MVYVIGIYIDVLVLCCVLDFLFFIMFLYFDENRNVVLKNYLSMIVNLCVCR